MNTSIQNALSVDVEEWFHILRSPATPAPETWASLESRAERNVDRILEVLDDHDVHGTFFWLGWMAERYPSLLQRCCDAGHEIASHGYAHVLPQEVGYRPFQEDITRAKKVLEDLTGQRVGGFRVAGFGIDDSTSWVFGVIKEAGYEYDASVFPTNHASSSLHGTAKIPYVIQTAAGPLVEVPLSAVDVCWHRLFMFGGGYLRLAPQWLIRWGITKLHKAGRPVVVYVHPREIDVDQPRMHLSAMRSFRYYVNIKTTLPKLIWLCRNYQFVPMRQLVDDCLAGNGHVAAEVDVVKERREEQDDQEDRPRSLHKQPKSVR